MCLKQITVSILVLFSLVILAAKGYSFQDNPVDNNQSLVDSLDSELHIDSVRSLFDTKYHSIIYDNPYRETYIASQLKHLDQQMPDPLAFAKEYIIGSDEGQGVKKVARPLWVLGTAFFLFLCIGVIRFIFPTEFRIIIEAYYRERLLQQVSKEDSIATSWPYVFLYGIFSFTLGLFIVVMVSGFKDPEVLTFNNYMRASAIIAGLFILKILIVRFISFVFDLDKIVREYVAVIYLVYFNSMLFLLPFLFFSLLMPTSYFKYILILFILSVSLLFTYRVLRTALHLFANTKFSIYYLIIYLCALEIAPILLLIRALGN